VKVHVIWLNYNEDAPSRGYWDQGFLEDFFAGDVWKLPKLEFEHHETMPADIEDFAVFVIPGRQNAKHVDAINAVITRTEGALVILTGDEEGDFPVEQLSHPNVHVWLMTPQPGRQYPDFVTKFIGTGYPPGLRAALPPTAPDRPLTAFFAGQDTHDRRHDCIRALSGERFGEVLPTEGFIQGLPQEDYWEKLQSCVVAAAPSGPVSPDSFRFFEALESGCVPLADTVAGNGVADPDFWQKLFHQEDMPFPLIKDWVNEAPKHIKRLNGDYPRTAHEVFVWWQNYKREFAQQFEHAVMVLSAVRDYIETPETDITVLIPSSPIPSNPSTWIIEETIDSIRAQDGLGECEIILMLDGCRIEQAPRLPAYQEYITKILWLCNVKWNNVLPVLFEEHRHQGVMTRTVLRDYVKTPRILFVEQDTPLMGDIDWEGLNTAIKSSVANVIRLHHEARILEPHEHLMLSEPIEVAGVLLRKTYQWSQRPHLASTGWYRNMINDYFGWESRTMIEDVMYSVLETTYREEKDPGWDRFRLWIYTPPTESIRRSGHTDGREGDPKYSMKIDYDGGRGHLPQWAPFIGVLEES